MEFHLTATECHLPYGITQCYLTPDTSEHTRLNPSHTGQYSIYLPWRDGRLSWPRWLLTSRWFTRPQAVTHPSTNRAQCRLTTLIEANELTTTLRHQYLNNVMTTHAGNKTSRCTDVVNMKSDSASTLWYQSTLLQSVVDAFDAVVFHRQ